MKNIALTLLFAITVSFASSATAAKEVFERVKPHVNVGSIGGDGGSLTLALAMAAGNTLEQAIDRATGEITAIVESENFVFEVSPGTGEPLAGSKPDEAYFVKVGLGESLAQTREHILLARQVGVPFLVVFADIDGVTDLKHAQQQMTAIHELLHAVGYDDSSSAIVVGSMRAALAGEKEGLLALADLVDALDGCMSKTNIRDRVVYSPH